jgi:hypothetical protein
VIEISLSAKSESYGFAYHVEGRSQAKQHERGSKRKRAKRAHLMQCEEPHCEAQAI